MPSKAETKKKKEQQQTAKNENLMEILRSNFNRSNLDGVKFTTSSKTGATKLEKKDSTTTLNMKNNPIESEDIFRHLNFVVGTEQKRKVIKTNLEKGVSQNNFKLKNGELLYDDGDTIQRKVPITDEQIDEILEDEYDQSGAGKGITLFYFHIKTLYLAITRKRVTDFLKTKVGYVLTRPTPHKTNKPIVAKKLNEMWSIDLIDMNPDDKHVYTDEITGSAVGTRNRSGIVVPSTKVKDNKQQEEEAKKNRPWRYIMTVVDVFSRKVWLEPLQGKYTEWDTTPAFKRIINRASGLPDDATDGVQKNKPKHLMMDNGIEFMAKFKEYCEEVSQPKIKLRVTRTYSPQANGIVESENKQVRRVLNELLVRNNSKDVNIEDTKWYEYIQNRTVENLRNNSYRYLLKDTPNNIYEKHDNAVAYGNVLANAMNRMDTYRDTEYKVGDKVFVAMKTIYSKIREIYKKGNQKLLAVIYHPVVLEVTRAGRKNNLQRKRYVVTESPGANGERRTLCHFKSNKPVYVYANELHRATIKQSDINMTAEQAVYINDINLKTDNTINDKNKYDYKWLFKADQKLKGDTPDNPVVVGDGYKFDMKNSVTNQPIFSGVLRQERCTANKRDGTRCSRIVTIGLPYCFQHRNVQKLKIKDSNIPQANKGLFAFDATKAPGDIVFKRNDRIATYDGEEMSTLSIENRYGDFTAPYGLQHHANREISSTDAALRRGIASLVNHTIISRTNARLSFNTDKGILKASKNIRNGQEILVNYGADYRFQDSVHTTKYFPPP